MATFALHSSQAVQGTAGEGLYLNTGAGGGSGTVVTTTKTLLSLNVALTVGTITTPITQAAGKIYINIVTTPDTITNTNVRTQCKDYERFEIVVPPVSGAVIRKNFPPFIARGLNVWAWVDVESSMNGITSTLSSSVVELN